MKKPKILLAEKYDISNKILKELTNLESRHILFATMNPPKSIQDISREQKIPQSSVYVRIASLKECSLVHEKVAFSEKGYITRYYQSKIKDIEISISKFEPKIRFTKNELVKND
jgi:predicted transcriptional regulator